jgi:mRNA-degrading endonuclease YafQ of YafQ-DinJ toxin-antitoxin module
MEVAFAPQFKRQFKKLSPPLKEEVSEKIKLFRDIKNHATLRVHTLKGHLQDRLSFSVNYHYRIIFEWEVKNKSAIFLTIGKHIIYD